MKAWYFSNKDCRLRYNDDRIIKVGRTHKVRGEPVLCKHGLHASINILDTLDYAPSPICWRVELGGVIVKGGDKCVATERTYLAKVDATEILEKFARMCALDVIHLWDAPDVVIQYLKNGDENLRAAAGDAAWYAARAAAWDAAWDAAWAAWDAAWAAWDAARAVRAAAGAAWYAARAAGDAAGDAGDAAREKQSKRLYRMMMKEL